MENLPNEILIHIFSFHQFDFIDLNQSAPSPHNQTISTLFQFLMNLTDDKALDIYKGENNVTSDTNTSIDQEQFPDSDRKSLHKLFNYYDPSSYDKEAYLLYQRYSNVDVGSIREEWFENENRQNNIEILFSSSESKWSNNSESYNDRLNLLHECVRDKKKFLQSFNIAFMNLLIVHQTFGIGFLGQFLVKYIHHYPLVYCNLSLVSRQWKEAADNQSLWEVSTGMLQQLLRLRSDLEFIRKKLFSRMDSQLDMSADENNYYSLKTPHDSGLKRFQVDENCSIRQRFIILSRYNTL
ncbi:predicted protein [Naegleria gruberi]|uniref:Predicted protein n=1 Tax=Naegleria gruberi TaxID=5762 RepID=D2VZ47_NAEGR|nr:uncharacterized protein NAEGRDRAFT_74356 [Naegleria gruberi]EFC37879.1 predicted protein [Naegleria gruberi]|eukprot:XP_002670623.1 predicted protein [Naegleria gruberi strain NEG-M]